MASVDGDADPSDNLVHGYYDPFEEDLLDGNANTSEEDLLDGNVNPFDNLLHGKAVPLDNLPYGNVAYFREAPLDILSNSRDENGDSLLSRAVISHVGMSCMKVIFERCPDLLYCQSDKGYHALHHAAARDGLEILKFIINADAQSQSRGGDKKLTRLLDYNSDSALMFAVRIAKSAEAVKLLVAADPNFTPPPNLLGTTPLDTCMKDSSLQEIFKLLLEIAPAQSKTRMGSNGGTILHHAVSSGDLTSVKYILQFCPDCCQVVDNQDWNFLHVAALSHQSHVVRFFFVEKIDLTLKFLHEPDKGRNTALQLLLEKMGTEMVDILCDADSRFFEGSEDVFWRSRNSQGESFLYKVVKENNLKLCKMICTKWPSHVYCQNTNGETALHHAAARIGFGMMVDLLISSSANADPNYKIDIESQSQAMEIHRTRKLLMMVDERGDTALHIGAKNCNFEVTKTLIEADPAIEYNVNGEGHTPLSITIHYAPSQENNSNTGKIRKLLLKKQPHECVAHRWGNGETILHIAALWDNLKAVLDIIKMCPDLVDLVDNDGMNYLHVAAKSKSIQVVKHMLGGKKVRRYTLNMIDNNGNTPLHIAALSGDEILTKCFLYNSKVDKKTTNHDDEYVLDAILFEYDRRKAGVGGVTDQVDQKALKEQSDFDLVVCALIATVSFTAGITVPGGYISDGQNKGTAVLSKQTAFDAFAISNTCALLFSLYAVFSHYCTRQLLQPKDIFFQVKVATYCTLGALYAMMVAFISGSFAVLANSTPLAISICVISCLFYIFSIRPLWKIVMQERGGSKSVGRRRGTCNEIWRLMVLELCAGPV